MDEILELQGFEFDEQRGVWEFGFTGSVVETVVIIGDTWRHWVAEGCVETIGTGSASLEAHLVKTAP